MHQMLQLPYVLLDQHLLIKAIVTVLQEVEVPANLVAMTLFFQPFLPRWVVLVARRVNERPMAQAPWIAALLPILEITFLTTRLGALHGERVW